MIIRVTQESCHSTMTFSNGLKRQFLVRHQTKAQFARTIKEFSSGHCCQNKQYCNVQIHKKNTQRLKDSQISTHDIEPIN